MKRRTLLLLPAALARCASPDAAIYTLAAVPGPARRGAPARIELRRPGLAGYLDRPEIVRASADYRVRVAGNERWGEPLGDMLGRVLAEDLSSRLPGSAVFTSAGSLSADADLAVEVDVQRFDADATGAVVLLAQVATRPGGGRGGQVRTVRLSEVPRSPATRDLVASLSELLGRLADAIAGMLAR